MWPANRALGIRGPPSLITLSIQNIMYPIKIMIRKPKKYHCNKLDYLFQHYIYVSKI